MLSPGSTRRDISMLGDKIKPGNQINPHRPGPPVRRRRAVHLPYGGPPGWPGPSQDRDAPARLVEISYSRRTVRSDNPNIVVSSVVPTSGLSTNILTDCSASDRPRGAGINAPP